jgi:hypothetical protein
VESTHPTWLEVTVIGSSGNTSSPALHVLLALSGTVIAALIPALLLVLTIGVQEGHGEELEGGVLLSLVLLPRVLLMALGGIPIVYASARRGSMRSLRTSTLAGILAGLLAAAILFAWMWTGVGPRVTLVPSVIESILVAGIGVALAFGAHFMSLRVGVRWEMGRANLL